MSHEQGGFRRASTRPLALNALIDYCTCDCCYCKTALPYEVHDCGDESCPVSKHGFFAHGGELEERFLPALEYFRSMTASVCVSGWDGEVPAA